MQSIDKQILMSIKKCGRGLVFYANRYSHFGTPSRVRKAMEQLVASGDIIRVARGIYCYPKIDKLFGLGVLNPGASDIAKVIAHKNKAQIVSTGEYAQYQLGLTQQIPMNVVFLTDGYSRTVKLEKGGTITFKRVAPKNFAYKNQIAMMVTAALRTMGQNEVNEEHIRIIHDHLRTQPKDIVFQDLQMMPDWIKIIVQRAYE